MPTRDQLAELAAAAETLGRIGHELKAEVTEPGPLDAAVVALHALAPTVRMVHRLVRDGEWTWEDRVAVSALDYAHAEPLEVHAYAEGKTAVAEHRIARGRRPDL